MAPGEYEFGTRQQEVMTVISGALTVKLPGSDDWLTFTSGQAFEVAANVKFQLQVQQDTAYLCTYAQIELLRVLWVAGEGPQDNLNR